ncbi:hypothetical protein B0O80DRAFT_462678 [Mortierella sp. GBAus27b]|nr:hypothetical protein B0O80DRAFT_462678 [Mortierella sp. GBAus27b]
MAGMSVVMRRMWVLKLIVPLRWLARVVGRALSGDGLGRRKRRRLMRLVRERACMSGVQLVAVVELLLCEDGGIDGSSRHGGGRGGGGASVMWARRVSRGGGGGGGSGGWIGRVARVRVGMVGRDVLALVVLWVCGVL